MIPLGLSAAELRVYHAALLERHDIDVRLDIRNLSGDRLGNIGHRLMDGQVNVDRAQPITRTMTLSLFDPYRTLHLDANSPADGALYLDRMIGASYGIPVEALERWVYAPVCVGPINKLSRSGDLVSIEVQGKEALSMAPKWNTGRSKFSQGTRKTTAIRNGLRDAGERNMSIPDLGAKLPRDRKLGKMTAYWPVLRGIASSIGEGRQLFYDGRGTARLRTWPGTPVYSFHADGPLANIVGEVQIEYDTTNVKNTIWVHGGKPKGARKAVEWVAKAPASHPLSPWRLGRNGVPRHLVEEVSRPGLRTERECRQLANRILHARLRAAVSITADALPHPGLEPADITRFVVPDGTVTVDLRQFSIPLLADGVMSLGYLKKIAADKKEIRHP